MRMNMLIFLAFCLFFKFYNQIFYDNTFLSSPHCICNSNTCCDTLVFEDFNTQEIFGPLNKLTSSNFFRFYKVNLERDCIFWPHEKKCALKNCKVDLCSQDELPPAFKINAEKDNELCSTNSDENLHNVNTELSDAQKKVVDTYSDDRSIDFVELKDYIENAKYIDLVKNPEAYTGYAGSSSANVWKSIFLENCNILKSKITLTGASETCIEFETTKRLLSGFRTSVSIHLSSRYPIKTDKFSTKWGINYDQLDKRFSPQATNNQGSLWIGDTFFAYALVSRAILKMKPILMNLDVSSGGSNDKTKDEMFEFLRTLEKMPGSFDETTLFTDLKIKPELLDAIRTTFQNISKILDCVGCDKCRLWGKVQMQGYATALKILFTPHGGMIQKEISPAVKLNRMEVVSIFNLFSRLSTSLNYLHLWRIHLEETAQSKTDL